MYLWDVTAFMNFCTFSCFCCCCGNEVVLGTVNFKLKAMLWENSNSCYEILKFIKYYTCIISPYKCVPKCTIHADPEGYVLNLLLAKLPRTHWRPISIKCKENVLFCALKGCWNHFLLGWISCSSLWKFKFCCGPAVWSTD